MAGQNIIHIHGWDSIRITNANGTMPGLYWKDNALCHRLADRSGKTTGWKPVLRFTPAMTAEIAAAVAASAADTIERKYGYEIQDGDRHGWEFVEVEDDAHGVYIRRTPGRTVTVSFSRDDLAK